MLKNIDYLFNFLPRTMLKTIMIIIVYFATITIITNHTIFLIYTNNYDIASLPITRAYDGNVSS